MSKKKNKLIFLGVGCLSIVAPLILFLTTNQSHFKAGDNININKFLKIDSTKYKFTDYSKIIGQNVVPWDNRKASLPKDMTDVKSINVFYKKCVTPSNCSINKQDGQLKKEITRQILAKATIFKKQSKDKNFKPYQMSTPGD